MHGREETVDHVGPAAGERVDRSLQHYGRVLLHRLTVEQLHREGAPHGLSVLTVNIQERRSTVAAWAREKNVTIPILLDTDGEATRQYSVIATPTAFLIDRDGRRLGRAVGPRDWTSPAGKALIAGLLAGPSRL